MQYTRAPVLLSSWAPFLLLNWMDKRSVLNGPSWQKARAVTC